MAEKEGLSRGERLQIMLSPEELAVVDDFRFQHRMPSRAAAARELFRIGLANAGFAAHSGMKSSEYSVLERPSNRSRKNDKGFAAR